MCLTLGLQGEVGFCGGLLWVLGVSDVRGSLCRGLSCTGTSFYRFLGRGVRLGGGVLGGEERRGQFV